MSGASMLQAKNALAQAVLSLNATDRFNVIDFDDDYEPLFRTAMPAIEINKKHAIRFIGRLDEGGGTEPLGAINFALNSRTTDSTNRLRQIIFITDGQVTNEDEILRSVRRHINQDRLFTIGIGSAPNSFLMTQLADYGKGAFTYIGSISEVEQKMKELFVKLTSPALTDIKITIPNNISSEQARSVIPDLYVGETIVAAFKLNELPDSITVKGKTIYGNYVKEITLTRSSQTTGIDVLWARRKIQGLMNQYRELYYGVVRDNIRNSVTSLALDYHLVSKFTSLVVVDISPSRPAGEALVSKPVVKKIKAPQTATNSTLLMIIGMLVMLIAFVYRRKQTA
jgi:Ca-activated chloride channel family protein